MRSRGVYGPGVLVRAPRFRAVRADARVAVDLAHRGLGCRLDPLCVTYTTIVEERTEHERVYVRPDERASR